MAKTLRLAELLPQAAQELDPEAPKVRAGLPPIASDSLTADQLQTLFFWAARRVCPAWRLREELLPVISQLFDWGLGVRAEGALDPDRGLLLCGNIGTGKTTMMEIVRLWASLVRPTTVGRYYGDTAGEPYTFAVVSCRAVCRDFTASYYRGLTRYAIARSICFDDLGTEPNPALHFGTSENVLAHVLSARYDRRHSLGHTHITTNLTPEGLRKAYGERVYDRLREMANIVCFRGASFRQRRE